MKISLKKTNGILTPFDWKDIPKLALITGKNGVGKSKLLQLIQHKLLSNNNNNFKDDTGIELYENEIKINTLKCQLLTLSWLKLEKKEINSLNVGTNALDSYRFLSADQSQIPQQYRKMNNEIIKKLEKNRENITFEEYEKYYYPQINLSFHETINDITRFIVSYFIEYTLKKLHGIEDSEILSILGPKPWIEINDLIYKAKLPYTIKEPNPEIIRGLNYSITIKDNDNNLIDMLALSSGERAIFSLIFYSFVAIRKGTLPDLLLLDEPDAHLHPQMTSYLLSVLKEIFVGKYEMQVIMTTHSPSTIAMADEGSIFQMTKSLTKIEPVTKNKAISLLTSGIIFVGTGSKFIFVEDKDDMVFYNTILEIGKEHEIISRDIPLIFEPVSTESKSGGKSVVIEWVKKIKKLNPQFNGIVDHDMDTILTPDIYYTKRYNIENYLTDPFNILICLFRYDKVPKSILGILKNNEIQYIKHLKINKLQSIIYEFFEIIKPRLFKKSMYLTEENYTEVKNVNYSILKSTIEIDHNLPSEITLECPVAFLNISGKDILFCLREEFGPQINFTNLTSSLKMNHIIPTDLFHLLSEVQNKS